MRPVLVNRVAVVLLVAGGDGFRCAAVFIDEEKEYESARIFIRWAGCWSGSC